MGISQSSKPPSFGPQALPYAQAKDLAQQAADCLSVLRQQLRLDLRLDTASLRYSQRDWRRSTLGGTLHEGGQEAVVLDLEQVYRLSQLLRHLRQGKSSETPTPGTNEQDRECYICFAEKAATVLPCTHSFCATCTQRYIIEQEEHKCPTCRTQFAGSRDTIKRSFYELIEQDRQVFEQARGIVLEMLSKYNTRVVRALAHQQRK